MKVLSGSEVSKEIKAELKEEVSRLKALGVNPALAVVLVGNDPASKVYVGHKKKACEALGIRSIERILPETCSQEELLAVIDELNDDASINGILCQVPLPSQCVEDEILRRIDPSKDVDCFHPYNVGLLATGMPKFMPCTPFGVLQILKRNNIETSGKEVVVVGRSNIVGRPLSILLSLKGYDATVTICHSRTKDLAATCKSADILVATIGRPKFITKEFVKEGATVIDVGINRIDDPTTKSGTRLVGDVDYNGISEVAGAATPVPGGVGPMTIAMLMYNTINAARMHANMDIFEL